MLNYFTSYNPIIYLYKRFYKMKQTITLLFLFLFVFLNSGFSQSKQDSTEIGSNISTFDVKGIVMDIDKNTLLPYTNIYVKHKHIGVVSNEKGQFSLDIAGLDLSDTLRFQYIGYTTRYITVGELDTIPIVYLKEEIFNLNETLIFGNTPNAKDIVRKILENKSKNYIPTTSKKQVFIRARDLSDLQTFELDCKRSSITQLDSEMIELLEEKIPKQSTSFTDFLGDLYFNGNEDDSIKFKIDPIRTVSLKEKDIAELEQFETIFENIFSETKDDEYWKVKTGILSQKIDIDEDSSQQVKDTLDKNLRKVSGYNSRIKYRLRYSNLDDKVQWEFIYSPGKYKYIIIGGTRINGEDVYIIDFKPGNSGMYQGRMYVSLLSYALIRADYEYAPEKDGKNIQLFGVGYNENQFSGSIYFEKKDSTYILKYFSRKSGFLASFERNISLLKKRKRFLLDKKIMEIKLGVNFSVITEEQIEYLVLDDKEITQEEFNDFEQKETLDIIYVDQFDDNLWRGYSIIEPTKRMKEYKKQKVN